MDYFSLILVGIKVIEGILAQATKAQLPAEILASIESALTSLRGVYGTPVTRAQLESLRG